MKLRLNGLALAGWDSLAHAAGFALIEQNASGLGNAYAGQAASAQDASTIFFNLAGMTRSPDSQPVLAGSLISPHAEFSGTVSPAIGGGDGGDAGDLAFVPNAYFAYRLSPDVRLGVVLYAPFGLKTEYDNSWMGRTQTIKSEMKTINLNPAIAWPASETLSLGAGVSIQYVEATLSNSAGAAGLATVQGDDVGWGFNLGAMWQMSDATRVGFAYRSEIDNTLEGDVDFSVSSVLHGALTADITLPASASLSVFQKLGSRWELLADVTWTGWSDFQELRINRTSGALLSLTPENWNDSYRYSVGANYHFDDKLTCAAVWHMAKRRWLAFGAQYRLSAASVIDVGYAHLFVDDARINKTEGSAPPITLSGEYESSVDILSAQLTLNL